MSHGTTRKAEYARQMNQSGRRKARRGRTINPPTKVILSKNRGKCAKYSSTGQVGNMNSVIWSCKSRSHPIKPQVAKIVRRRNARTAAPHLPRTVIFCAFGTKKRQYAAKLRAKRLFRRRNGVQAARNNNQVVGTSKLPGLITCFLETLRLHHGHISTSASGTLLTQNRS